MRQQPPPSSTLRGEGVMVRFRLLRAEYEHLVRIARRDGVSVSQAIRAALRETYAMTARATTPTAENAPDVHRRGPVVTRTPRDSRPTRRGEFHSGR
jgi:hypothetical protein